MTLGALTLAAPAVAAPFSTSCTNTVTNNNTQVDVKEMSASVPASVPPNTNFSVTAIKGVVNFPGSVFLAGYNLGLVQDGTEVDGTIQMVMKGTGTTQGSQSSNIFPFKLKVKINDPDGMFQTGDESSEDVLVPFNFDDETWTSGADEGPAAFSLSPVAKTAAQKDKGGMQLTAAIPTAGNPLVVKFGCNPGTVEGSDPGIPHYDAVAAPYATSTVAKAAPAPPPVTTQPPPSTGPSEYTIPNSFSFGKVKVNKKKGTAKLPVTIPSAGVLALKAGKVAGKTLKPNAEGKYLFTIKARKGTLAKLKRKGKVKVKLTVTFTPNGGTALSKTKTVTLKKTIKKKKVKKKK